MSLLTDLGSVCTELLSDKPMVRNKATKKLDALLTSSKSDIIEIFRARSEDAGRVSYANLFNSAVEATIQHAAKIDECRDSKNVQLMRNKNYLFRAIVTKLIDYNREDNNNFIPKTIIFDAFKNGFDEPSAILHFLSLFLHILEGGIFKSPSYVLELKVNEFSRILSYLFQVRLSVVQERLDVLRTINTTIGLAVRHVQINEDLIAYLPQLSTYVMGCKDEPSKTELIRLFYLFVSELAVDYHYTICTELQQLLPTLCAFYNFRMSNESKELFFHAIYLYLHVVYPQVNSGDVNTFGIALNDKWSLALRKLETIIEVELREQSLVNTRSVQALHGSCLRNFVKMAALVMYLIKWHVETDAEATEQHAASRQKIVKRADKLEDLLEAVQKEPTKFDRIWLAIVAEIVSKQATVINVTNLQQLVLLSQRILSLSITEHDLHNIRVCLTAALRHERDLVANQSMSYDHCRSNWSEIVAYLIAENSIKAEVIGEKQLLLQALITERKMNADNCTALLNAFVANTLMKRNECLLTIRHILVHAELCGIDKTGEIVARLLAWMNEAGNKLDARIVLHNVAPFDATIVADTSAIAVINFLVEPKEFSESAVDSTFAIDDNLQLLLYKHNLKFVCIEQHGKELRRVMQTEYFSGGDERDTAKNCLFQNNYELLMRLLNFETSQGVTLRDISAGLVPLLKMCKLLRFLLHYDVLGKGNLPQCPLIKRVGFFLSHLEFQVKSNSPLTSQSLDHGAMSEVLQRLNAVFKVFTDNIALLQYLEAQPLEEMINFLGATLRLSCKPPPTAHQLQDEFTYWSAITRPCLQVLARICASATHNHAAFAYIQSYRLNVDRELDTFLDLVEIFCGQQVTHATVADWFYQKLKSVFRYHYTNVIIMTRVVALLPVICTYVQLYDATIENMLIALHSLLRIALKKSYPSRLTASLIDSLRLIARNCPSIVAQQSFINICLSIAKFLPFPALRVQFMAVNAISALLDTNWLQKTALSLQAHLNFCTQLYEHLDLRALPMSTRDVQQNSKAIGVQVMAGAFLFSTHFRGAALEQLAIFSLEHQLGEADFYEFPQIASFTGHNLAQLARPYVSYLIHSWSSKLHPIEKFPYYLCGNKHIEFMTENLAQLVNATLLHGKAADLKTLTKYKPHEELLAVALPIAQAYILPYRADCVESQAFDYKQHIERLADNYTACGVDVLNYQEVGSANWYTLYNILTLLRDEKHFAELMDFPLYGDTRRWCNISACSLRRCLSFYITDHASECLENADFYAAIAADGAAVLVRALGAMKRDVLRCHSAIDAVRNLSKLCTATDVIIDMVPQATKLSTGAQICAKLFLRDTLSFIVQLLRTAESGDVQKASILFLQHFLDKPIISKGIGTALLAACLNDVFKALIRVAEHATLAGIEGAAIALMQSLLDNPNKELVEVIPLLDELPMSENFAELRLRQATYQRCSDGDKDISTAVQSFLRTRNRGVEGIKAMRHYLARNKQHLQLGSAELVGTLVKRLIQMVRTASSPACSLEAAKCLGEVGALRIEGTAFYFQTDSSFYEDESSDLQPLEIFMRSMLVALERSLFDFDPDTYEAVCAVLEYAINAKPADNLFKEFPYLSVFRVHAKNKTKRTFAISADIVAIDWTTVLLAAATTDSYEQWVCSFVANAFEKCDWPAFGKLAAVDSSFADATLLPFITLLLQSKDQHLGKLLAMLEYFFHEFARAHGVEPNNNQATGAVYREKRIISKMLNICECVRLRDSWQVRINLLNVVRACNYCQAYFMAIMYLELWAATQKDTSGSASSSQHSILADEEFQECAKKAYQSVGCCDAIAGFLDPLNSRLQFLQLNNCWSEMLVTASADEMLSDELYAAVLKRNGLLSLAGLRQAGQQPIDFEVCWRLSDWGTVVEGHAKVNTLNDMEHEYEKHHFNALKCIHNREENNSLAALTHARHCVIAILKEISIECLQSVYKYVTWLQLLQQAEDFCQVQFGNAASSAQTVEEIFQKWQSELNLCYGSFQCKEQVLSHQLALFKTAGLRASRKINAFYADNPISICMLKCVRECKLAGEMNLAKRNMAALQKIPIASANLRATVLLEDAEICYKAGQQEISKAILQSCIKTSQFVECPQYLTALRMYGEFLLESNTENFETVLNKYFNMSTKKLDRYSEATTALTDSLEPEPFVEFERKTKRSAYEVIAKYADREYTQLDAFVNSEEFQTKRRIIAENRKAGPLLGNVKTLGLVTMKRFANLDEREIKYIEDKRTENLCIAVQHYISYCQIDESNSMGAIYRIIALWFANQDCRTLHGQIEQPISMIPTYKWICVLNQMTARLSSDNASFLGMLKSQLIRCVREHPHQTLYQLYPLIYNDSGTVINVSGDSRAKIAKDIIQKATFKANADCIRQLELILPALIEYANTDLQPGNLTLSDKLKRLKNLSAVQCPTIELPVLASGAYNDIISIQKWEEQVSLVGGINAPKKLICLCSDGKRRPQLLKGKDDMRQDAVMQQVFELINEILANEPTAVQRKLQLRTYKIVPLSMRSGILQWCENAMPIAVYLSGTGDGKNGAHYRYHPTDLTPQKCRQIYHHHLKAELAKRQTVYKQLCAKMRPAFHYFLLEKFLVPGIWFERRLAYTNSVATTSMVGFIVGLGDRHAQNILIDEKSGEVIHIDFGIAFEQGKIMPTPETVPFRLTRDMVAPMGACETNGVFKKSCEATMQVLRRNQALITTILEVLLYNPLYMWSVVPRTCGETTEGRENSMAQRALLCVQNKLEGKQAGVLGSSDVAAQVQRLINEAVSPINLCQLYSGWDPYL